MFKNYLKTAIRSLLRHRFFSAINVFGLAVAMIISMAIIMLVADQLSYDRYNTRSDRIFQVTTVGATTQDGQGEPNSASTMRLKQELLENYTGIEKVVRFKKGFGNSWLEFESQDVLLLSKGFFSMLAIAIVVGVALAHVVNSLWLNNIAYHTSLDIVTISIGVFILIFFGAITIGSQTIRAAFVKPVNNLKSE